jgi:hypothetical protein
VDLNETPVFAFSQYIPVVGLFSGYHVVSRRKGRSTPCHLYQINWWGCFCY